MAKKEISLEQADEQVTNALFQSAIKGNVTAQIFWLCNRQPEKWTKKANAGKAEIPAGYMRIEDWLDYMDEVEGREPNARRY